MHDVRRKMAEAGLRPIGTHSERIKELFGWGARLFEHKTGGAHGGATLRGVEVDGKKVFLEAERSVSPTEQRIYERIRDARTKHLRIPKIIELRDNRLVTEFVPGQSVTLFSRDFEGRSERESEKAGRLFESAIEGLKELHSLGISRGRYEGISEMHGLNFKIGEDGELYWFDFGGSTDKAKPADKAFDIGSLIHAGVPVYGEGRTREYKLQRVVDAYFREGLTAEGLAVLEELARGSWIQPKRLEKYPWMHEAQQKECQFFIQCAKEMLDELPEPIRNDLLDEYWRIREQTVFKPNYDPSSDLHKDFEDRRAEWLEKWKSELSI